MSLILSRTTRPDRCRGIAYAFGHRLRFEGGPRKAGVGIGPERLADSVPPELKFDTKGNLSNNSIASVLDGKCGHC